METQHPQTQESTQPEAAKREKLLKLLEQYDPELIEAMLAGGSRDRSLVQGSANTRGTTEAETVDPLASIDLDFRVDDFDEDSRTALQKLRSAIQTLRDTTQALRNSVTGWIVSQQLDELLRSAPKPVQEWLGSGPTWDIESGTTEFQRRLEVLQRIQALEQQYRQFGLKPPSRKRLFEQVTQAMLGGGNTPADLTRGQTASSPPPAQHPAAQHQTPTAPAASPVSFGEMPAPSRPNGPERREQILRIRDWLDRHVPMTEA